VLSLRTIAWTCLLLLGCGAGDPRARREQEQLARFSNGTIFEDLVSQGSWQDLGMAEDLRLLAPVIGRGACVPVEAVRPDGARDALRNGVWTYEYVRATRVSGADGEERTQFTDIAESSLGLESQGEYQADRRVGAWTFWYPDGKLRAKGSFVDGARSGPWEFRRADDSVDPDRTGVYSGGDRVPGPR